jgi:large subunit ribosomal protein L6
MSRVGRAPIEIPAGVKISVEGNLVEVTGPRGELKFSIHPLITVRVTDNSVLVQRQGDTKKERSLHGLCRSLVANMVKGVSEGYERAVEMRGIGFRAQVKDGKLNLVLGYSHSIDVDVPEWIEVEVVKKPTVEQMAVTLIIIKGIDKQGIGKFAASLRKLRPPEPYKGKGVRNVGEYIKRKAGKKAA